MSKINAKIILEIVGAPKDHVEEVIQRVAEKIKSEFEVITSKIFETKPIKKFWGSFIEVEMNFKDIEELFMFCFDYMPSSIEIFKPEKLELNNLNLMGILNDLVGKLHNYDLLVKNLKAENFLIKRDLEKKK